jgi:hypothetical protein
MRKLIVYLAFVTVALSSVLASQASAKKSGPNLFKYGATGEHIKIGKFTTRTTTGSPGPTGNVGASPRDASTGQSSGKRMHKPLTVNR